MLKNDSWLMQGIDALAWSMFDDISTCIDKGKINWTKKIKAKE